MRFCNYKTRGLQVICPPSIGVPPGEYEYDWAISDPVPASLAPLNFRQRDWVGGREMECREYRDMLKEGIPPEDARFSLPIATKTELSVTLNLRMWRHVIRDRALNPKAQWEIRGIFNGIYEDLVEKLPAVFSDLKPEEE
jgi:thymidylate synthase (FAD)